MAKERRPYMCCRMHKAMSKQEEVIVTPAVHMEHGGRSTGRGGKSRLTLGRADSVQSERNRFELSSRSEECKDTVDSTQDLDEEGRETGW